MDTLLLSNKNHMQNVCRAARNENTLEKKNMRKFRCTLIKLKLAVSIPPPPPTI
jgi:hypothetical protein